MATSTTQKAAPEMIQSTLVGADAAIDTTTTTTTMNQEEVEDVVHLDDVEETSKLAPNADGLIDDISSHVERGVSKISIRAGYVFEIGARL